MTRLYVIGPVTGIEYDNRPEFEKVRATLECALGRGCKVGIPHDVVPAGAEWSCAMRLSIAEMLAIRHDDRFRPELSIFVKYDGVAMLDGWEASPGARLERQVAESCGIECRPWHEWIDSEPQPPEEEKPRPRRRPRRGPFPLGM